MMDQVNAKAKKNKGLQDNSHPKTHKEYVLDFITKMDEICITAQDEICFAVDMEAAAEMLLSKLKTVDQHVHAEVIWNGSKNWKELRAVGVTITWSREHLKLYPGTDEQEFVDVTELLFM